MTQILRIILKGLWIQKTDFIPLLGLAFAGTSFKFADFEVMFSSPFAGVAQAVFLVISMGLGVAILIDKSIKILKEIEEYKTLRKKNKS